MSYSGSFRFQRYDVNTSIKNIRFFGVTGGMQPQYHPEKLPDGGHVLVENCDIIAGESFVNRGAYVQTNSPSSPISGMTQGRFVYNYPGGSTVIVAIGGNLYTVSGNTYTKQTIVNMPNGFQTTRPIEAVQYRVKMYIASGSGLITYDGTTFTMITGAADGSTGACYAPNGLEALYVGFNGYATNPTNYLSNLSGAADAILGVEPDSRYGVINKQVTFTAFYEYITADQPNLQFQFEVKQVSDVDYPSTPAQAFGNANGATFKYTFATKGDYMIRVSLQLSTNAGTILSQYVLPKFTVNSIADPNPAPGVTFTNLSQCNRIFVWYDRMMMYGDPTNPDFLYISQVNQFDYWPTNYVIVVADPLRGALTNVTQFKNFLVCFTEGSIQQITGTDPSTYALNPVMMNLGCPWGWGVQVMTNMVAFVGNDNQMYCIKTFTFATQNDRFNVERFDMDVQDDIANQFANATNVQTAIWDNQLYIYIETSGNHYFYRYYYLLKVWVRDALSFPLQTIDSIGNTLNCTSPTGGIMYQKQRGVYFDGVNDQFSMHLITKDYDMNMPHHRKKMKMFQLLCELTEYTAIDITVYGDNNVLLEGTYSHDPNQNSDADKIRVYTSGPFRYTKVDLLIPVVEDIQLTGYAFIFKLNTPK